MKWPWQIWRELRAAWRFDQSVLDRMWEDDLDLSRDEVMELFETGEPVEIVEPPEDLRTAVREEFELSGPLLDAWAAEELPEDMRERVAKAFNEIQDQLDEEVDDTLLDGLSDPGPELTPEEEAKIRKIVSDTLEDEREGRVSPEQEDPGCQSNLKGLDGKIMFYCDKTNGHSGFHQNIEYEMTWVSGEQEER